MPLMLNFRGKYGKARSYFKSKLSQRYEQSLLKSFLFMKNNQISKILSKYLQNHKITVKITNFLTEVDGQYYFLKFSGKGLFFKTFISSGVEVN